MQADHLRSDFFSVFANRVGARDNVAVKNNGNAFVVGGSHFLGSEDNGVLLAIIDCIGGDDVHGFATDSHSSFFHFGGYRVVVFVATGADEGKAA